MSSCHLALSSHISPFQITLALLQKPTKNTPHNAKHLLKHALHVAQNHPLLITGDVNASYLALEYRITAKIGQYYGKAYGIYVFVMR